LYCEVSDTGVGLHEADAQRLFERFRQADMSATRQAGGTGLGLAITKAIIEAHGGTLGVKSAPGRGATFWFSVPPMTGCAEI
jgi:signal transduction histidine kinase